MRAGTWRSETRKLVLVSPVETSAQSVVRYLDRNGLLQAVSKPELRVLVPIIRAQTAGHLLSIGDALVRQTRGSGNVLGLVEVPAYASEAVAHEVMQRRRELLRWIAATDEPAEARSTPGLGILVRVVHDVALGIREAAYETNADLVAVEWPGLASRRPRLLASVIANLSANPSADLLLVRPGIIKYRLQVRARRILVPVRGGPNARLALKVAGALAGAWDARLTVLHVADPHHHPDRKAQESLELDYLLSHIEGAPPELIDREAADIGGAIREAAAEADLVVLGASAPPTQGPVLVRAELAAALRRLTGTIILVRTVESLMSAQVAEPTSSPALRRPHKSQGPSDR